MSKRLLLSRSKKALALASVGTAIAAQVSVSNAAINFTDVSSVISVPSFTDLDTLSPYTSGPQRSISASSGFIIPRDMASDFAWVTGSLAFGENIDSSDPFTTGTDSTLSNGFITDAGAGVEQYAGFRWEDQGLATDETWYGWISYETTSTFNEIFINGFAYDDSGGAISAGAVPEPSMTFLFGIGVIGMALRRSRKAQ